MPLELASDLLPTASDVLPKSAKVIRLHRTAKAKQAAAPTRITKAKSISSPALRGRKKRFIGMGRFRASGCGSIHPAERLGSSSTVMQGDARGGTLSDRRRLSTLQRPASSPVTCLRRVAGGANPSVERRQARKAATVGDIFEAYLTHAEKEQRPPRSIRRAGTCGNMPHGSTGRPSRTLTGRRSPACTSFLGPRWGAFRRTGCWPRCQQHGSGRFEQG